MSFMHEVKYKGSLPLTDFKPTHAQQRPGALEAAAAVARMVKLKKDSSVVVISCSQEGGVKAVDTNFNPPHVVFDHTVYEIAHCGVDPSHAKYFTLIVGKRGEGNFFCHIFKASTKDMALRITRAIASACTLAFQEHQRRRSVRDSGSSGGTPVRTGSMAGPSSLSSQHRASVRASVRRPGGGGAPRLTDSWFRPSMSRGEVNTILRTAAIGDFIVRESQSRPNDYALSVQTGNMIWTGLIVAVEGGYQLGERGGLVFPELTDLIGYYAQNKFMNDANGYPLTLRLPYDVEQSGGSVNRGASFRVPDWRQSVRGKPEPEAAPTFKNPPMFDAIMDGDFPADPSCGWPESDDEGEDNFNFLASNGSRKGRRINLEEMDEREAFEKFMNQGGFDLDEEGNPIDISELNIEEEYEEEIIEETIGGGSTDQNIDDAFSVPGVGSSQAQDEAQNIDEAFGGPAVPAEPAQAAEPTSAEPEPTEETGTGDDSSGMTITEVADVIWAMVSPDEESCVGGQEVRPLLLKSGLDIPTLGRIWMEVDQEKRGKIDYDQLQLVLGLMSQAQRGEEINLEEVDVDDTPGPTIEDIC